VYVKNLQEPTGKNGLSFIFSSINGHRKNTFTSSWCLVLLSSSEMWFGNMCSGESEGVAPQHIPSRTHQKTRQHNHQLVNILLLTMEEKIPKDRGDSEVGVRRKGHQGLAPRHVSFFWSWSWGHGLLSEANLNWKNWFSLPFHFRLVRILWSVFLMEDRKHHP